MIDLLDVTGGRPFVADHGCDGAHRRIGSPASSCCCTARKPPTRCSSRSNRGAGLPTAKIDLRNYGIGAQILRDLGVGKMKLLASPRKMPTMDGFDLEVTGYLTKPN